MKKRPMLRSVVALTGGAIVFLGLNVALGGIRTLGWQGPQDFVSVSDLVTYMTQDSHVRFIGGVWSGVGALFVAGGFALEKLRPTLIALCMVIAVAGLFRLSALDAGAILNLAIAPSMILELLGFPMLAVWLARTGSVTVPI